MLNWATFLSPLLGETYAYIAHYVEKRLGYATTFHVGQSLDEFSNGQTDVAFLCGLLFVHMARGSNCPIETIAAPVVQGKRYQGQPIYFSDVVVRRESAYSAFADLQGCTWAFNEPASHSGYNIVRYSLMKQGKDLSYFGTLLETGAHMASLQAVLEGKADATALDSHVLDVLLARNKHMSEQIRVIAMLGPTTIPAVVIAKRIDEDVKQRIRQVLYSMHQDADAARILRRGLIERLVPIRDEDYQDIRDMWECVQRAQSLQMLA